MRRKLSTILCAQMLLLAAFVAPSAAQQKNAEGQSAVAEGGFRLKGLDGKFYDNEGLRGDVLVLSFGATWCTPCVWEMVAIEELKVEYAAKPVKFLWVSIEDAKQTSNNVLRHYVKQRRMTVPVLRDPNGETLSRFSDGPRIPVVLFFDREGRWDGRAHRGMPQDTILYKQLVRARLNALLEDKKAVADGASASK